MLSKSSGLCPGPKTLSTTSCGLFVLSPVSLSFNPKKGLHANPRWVAMALMSSCLSRPLYLPSGSPLIAQSIKSGLPNIKSVWTKPFASSPRIGVLKWTDDPVFAIH